MYRADEHRPDLAGETNSHPAYVSLVCYVGPKEVIAREITSSRVNGDPW